MKMLVLLLVIIGIAGTYDVARGYSVTGMKYDHTAITYSCGDPITAEAVRMWAAVSGISDGGCSANPDILMTFPTNWTYGSNVVGWAAYTSTSGHTINQCTIGIRSDSVGFIGVYLHEIGHCLGSSHSEVTEAAMAPYCCHWLAPDDIAMITSLYGPEPTPQMKYRATLPMVAQ